MDDVLAVTNHVPLYPSGVTPEIFTCTPTAGFKVLVTVTVVPLSVAAVMEAGATDGGVEVLKYEFGSAGPG